ncbi:type II toxin-antitoxin system VapC family toxin [Brevundimonas sp. AJA228-03]|uniref:type II toxin-antitoxin system VapC family toxin n=1 Tax=Brevundimonas sp. AJA228-03 TaxID=2752515 RepID=UPI001ADFE892|nr:type II toxin-antitoxin system VapC family toxin [Brevundimonas sp. AJA228-03]QTN20780.1 type II toxin-antitoxin system VapC family toxin [Brevundimonas sp. AJA228-03]
MLDASILVSVVTRELTSSMIDAVLDQQPPPLVSDFCVAESSAAIARLVRVGARMPVEAESLFDHLDVWVASASDRVSLDQGDIAMATDLVRRHNLVLRAPDAIHIAAATRLEATILTLDRGMARAAAALGVPCLNPAEAEAPGEPKD